MGHLKKRPAWVPTGFDPGEPTWKSRKPIFYESLDNLSSNLRKKFKNG